MRPLGLDINRIETAAGGHEEPVPARASETDVAAHLWQQDLSDALTFWRENLHAVIAFAAPT
jgi:hypothetical protein